MSDTDLRATAAVRTAIQPDTGAGRADNTAGARQAVSSQPRFPLRAQPAWADGSLQTPNSADSSAGALPLRGRDASGGRRADGDALRPARGRGDHDGPCFHLDVPPNGYAWWYVDGISTDGTKAVSVIGFIGSVFSPWYAWSGRKDPANHCCINVATYGKGGRFTMTDRGRAALHTTPDTLQVGPSSMHWNGRELVIDINEISGPPIISRVRGQITMTPHAMTSVELPLTPDGAHVWRPFAPSSEIKVDLEAKGWQWSGHGYFDSNFGTRSLEEDFSFWTWGRYPTKTGATCIYDAVRRDGSTLDTAIAFDNAGRARIVEAPPRTRFKRSLWQVMRETRADPGVMPKQVLPMLDAPFYSRSAVQTQIDGEVVTGVHEALDLNRFRSPLLKPMLAVRVPRRRG